MSNYVPNETKGFDVQKPTLMNAENKILIAAMNEVSKKHLRYIRNSYYTYNIKCCKGN